MERIFHITTVQEWLAAQRVGHYEGDTLDTDGFIHCSFAHQVAGVANATFVGHRDLILLEVEPERLTSQVRTEDAYPHVYGPIRVEAVVNVHELDASPDGSFSFP